MPSLVIKNLPEEIHQRLKQQAVNHHRSMTKEAVAILSHELMQKAVSDLPAPFKGEFPLTDEFIEVAKHAGRE